MPSAIVFEALQAEQEALEAVLADLDDAGWSAASAAPGWTVADVVLHLAQTEEAVVHTLRNDGTRRREYWLSLADTVDGAMEALVRAERAPGAEVMGRWVTARREALVALRRADPKRAVTWVATPLKPRTLATTRLAEHWAHALDVAEALGIDWPDTERLRHIAWLAHATLPYAFALAGHGHHGHHGRRNGHVGPEVYCELTAPDGSLWRFGPPFAASSITGPAADFCRVAARRLAPEDSALVAAGPAGPLAMEVLRTYAG